MSKKEIKSLKGVAVHHYKNTEDYVTEIMPEPDRVYLPCVQHMGAPCTPVVKVGDLVKPIQGGCVVWEFSAKAGSKVDFGTGFQSFYKLRISLLLVIYNTSQYNCRLRFAGFPPLLWRLESR